MEELIETLKKRIDTEENTDTRIGLRVALLLAQEQYIKDLNKQINNHIKQK